MEKNKKENEELDLLLKDIEDLKRDVENFKKSNHFKTYTKKVNDNSFN